MSARHTFLKWVRSTHLYLGVFITPALIFFAFTGAMQTFSLHETTRGSSYKPPVWVATLAQIHKKQNTAVPVRKLQPVAPQNTAPAPGHAAARPESPASLLSRPHHTLPLKLFFLLVSIGLFLSSVTGLYMTYKFVRNKRLITATLAIGTVLPIALLFI
ncbi:MAG TPA: PepSY domain-containing protein [Edaphobacter sp.]|nr:PepSY domain-containing protein [Edaphobacter sp.]